MPPLIIIYPLYCKYHANMSQQISIFYIVSYDSDYIRCKLVNFHLGIAEIDVRQLWELTGVGELPVWFDRMMQYAIEREELPIDYPGTVPRLPNLNTMLAAIPKQLISGYLLPQWDGYDLGGFHLNPGGDIAETAVPYNATRRTIRMGGTTVWLQSGALSGHCSLVSSLEVYYQKSILTPAMYPGINLADYVPAGNLGAGIDVYRRGSPTYHCGEAYPEISYFYDNGNNPPITRFCPAWGMPPDPETGGFPEWHFLAGNYPFEMWTVNGGNGIGYLMLGRPYTYENWGLPRGHNATFPNQDWKTAIGAILEDTDHSTLLARDLVGTPCQLPPISTIEEVVIEEETEEEEITIEEEQGLPTYLLEALYARLKLETIRPVDSMLLFNGMPFTVGGHIIGGFS